VHGPEFKPQYCRKKGEGSLEGGKERPLTDTPRVGLLVSPADEGHGEAVAEVAAEAFRVVSGLWRTPEW
jgi:hypothetical protein